MVIASSFFQFAAIHCLNRSAFILLNEIVFAPKNALKTCRWFTLFCSEHLCLHPLHLSFHLLSLPFMTFLIKCTFSFFLCFPILWGLLFFLTNLDLTVVGTFSGFFCLDPVGRPTWSSNLTEIPYSNSKEYKIYKWVFYHEKRVHYKLPCICHCSSRDPL